MIDSPNNFIIDNYSKSVIPTQKKGSFIFVKNLFTDSYIFFNGYYYEDKII